MIPDLFAAAARRDLREALTWLAQEDEVAAEALLDAVLRSAERIVERPMLGRLRRDLLPAPYRFWRVARFPYLIVYNAARRPLVVLRVLHMKRDLAPLLVDLASGAGDPPD